MKNIGFYQSIFVAQTSRDSCGIACLCMILRYTLQKKSAEELALQMSSMTSEQSLLDLKNIIGIYGLNARCVQMDTDTLRKLKASVILHTVNPDATFHFLTLFTVVYSDSKYFYVIGDPAYGIKIICETSLITLWQSSAGLYIPDLPEPKTDSGILFWKNAFDWQFIPKPLWYFIPVINLISFLFALALSALLQHLLNIPFDANDYRFRITILLFILIIILSKSLLTHIRQRLLILVNKIVNTQLTIRLAQKTFPASDKTSFQEIMVKKRLLNIAKFQLSVNGIISVLLSEGLVLIGLLGVQGYLDRYAALVSLCFVMIAFYAALRKMPYEYAWAICLNSLHSKSEELLISPEPSGDKSTQTASGDPFNTSYRQYIRHASSRAIQQSAAIFRNEAAGGLNMIVILGLEMSAGNKSPVLILSITVLGYLIMMVLQRINSALPVIYEGIQAARSLEL